MLAFFFNSLQDLGNDVKTFREIAKSTQGSQIKNTERLTEQQKSTCFTNEKVKEYEENRREKEREIKKLKYNIGIWNIDKSNSLVGTAF